MRLVICFDKYGDTKWFPRRGFRAHCSFCSLGVLPWDHQERSGLASWRMRGDREENQVASADSKRKMKPSGPFQSSWPTRTRQLHKWGQRQSTKQLLRITRNHCFTAIKFRDDYTAIDNETEIGKIGEGNLEYYSFLFLHDELKSPNICKKKKKSWVEGLERGPQSFLRHQNLNSEWVL